MTSSGRASSSGIGTALRAERQRRHISLDAIARGTLVRHDFLELIDEDRVEELPTGAYAKGFIRAYAAHLGLDPDPFVDAYDKRCGRPEPELSSVVRRGVRVPPAARKRGWQIAIGSALTIIVLLVLFGAFRSGDEPATVPTVPAASSERLLATAVPNAMGAVVRLEVIEGETWIEATADGQPVFGETLTSGASKTFKGDEHITLFAARAGNIRLIANGRILGTPVDASYKGTFTPSTTKLPPNEVGQEDPASEAPATSEEPAETPDNAVVGVYEGTSP